MTKQEINTLKRTAMYARNTEAYLIYREMELRSDLLKFYWNKSKRFLRQVKLTVLGYNIKLKGEEIKNLHIQLFKKTSYLIKKYPNGEILSKAEMESLNLLRRTLRVKEKDYNIMAKRNKRITK